MHSFLLTRFSQNLSPRRTAFYPQIFLKTPFLMTLFET